MPIEITISNRQRAFPVDVAWIKSMAESVLAAVCKDLKQDPAPWLGKDLSLELEGRGQLSLVLVSDRQIRKLNRQWRDKDQPTDVLSFPLGLELPPPGLPFEVGEVVISVEKASQQAKDYGHDLNRELAFLFTHGVLHVLGFDHETDGDEKEMFGRQKKVLNIAGFTR